MSLIVLISECWSLVYYLNLLFLYGIVVWGAAYQQKYPDIIDRAHRFGLTTKKTIINDLTKDGDSLEAF